MPWEHKEHRRYYLVMMGFLGHKERKGFKELKVPHKVHRDLEVLKVPQDFKELKVPSKDMRGVVVMEVQQVTSELRG